MAVGDAAVSGSRLVGFGVLMLVSACRGGGRSGTDFDAVRIRQGVVLVEKALTEREKATGLMFRTSLPTNRGMVFLFDPPSRPSFYMRNTAVPLDLVLITPEGRVASVHRMEPFDERTLHTARTEVSWALEVNAGWVDRHGVRAGDRVEFLKVGKEEGAR